MDMYSAQPTTYQPEEPVMPQVTAAEPVVPVEAPTDPPPSSGGKKKLIFGLVALLLIIGLAAAGYVLLKDRLLGSGSAEPVTLTYWGLWESPEVMQPLIDEYQALNQHVTINYEQRPVANHYTTVKARLSATSSSGEMPDIVRLHSSWVPVLSNYLSVLPKSVMSASEYEARQYPVTKDTLLIGDAYYGLPLTMDGLALVYNQQLFNEAGITSVPVTWDDVRQASAKIVKRDERGNITQGGIAMGGANNVDHFSEILSLLFMQNGVAITNGQGQLTFDRSLSADGRNLGAEALAFYTLFATTEESWSDAMEPSTLAFSKGQVGMILVPSWRVLSLIEQNPQLDIQVAVAPQLTSDRNVGYASYWTETVPLASAHQTEAWKFLAWLNETKQQQQLFASAQQARSLAQPPANPQASSVTSGDVMIAPYVEQSVGYRSSLFASGTGADELNGAMDQALAVAINKTKSSGSNRESAAAEALTEAAEAITVILQGQR